MSGLRGRSAVAADHRSALPRVPGIPWWGATIVAVVFTAIGVALDAVTGDKALSGVFAAFYVLGCIAAVVVVRQSGVFTAVIQPPLILFIAVPFAYFVFHGSTFTGMKDTLINCGYPLIERFPLMFFTTATVLLIGMARWYVGSATRRAAPKDAEAAPDSPQEHVQTATATKPRRSTRNATARPNRAAAKASAAATVGATGDEAPRPQRKPTRTAATDSPRSSDAAAGTGSRRSRHSRPPDTEVIEPVANRPRRRSAPPADPPVEPRRHTRAGEPREREPRERRPMPPSDRRSPERPERYDRPRRERGDAQERPERPQRRPRAADYEPYEPPPTSRTNSSNGTHHPVSRVRYRSTDDGESRVEQRTKPRPSRHAAPDPWE